jgi:hypothetical protein
MNRQGAMGRTSRSFFHRPLRVIHSVIAVLPLLLSAAASADAYGPAEARPRREGFAGGFAIGPSMFVGTGELDGKRGVGGDVNLRVGTSATPTLLWQLELQGGGYLGKVIAADGSSSSRFNAHATLTLGGQVYLRETLWLRAGIGVANFVEREGRQSGPAHEETRRDGLAFTAGGGYDFFRRGMVAVDLEVVTSAALFGGAFMGHSALLLGLIWY